MFGYVILIFLILFVIFMIILLIKGINNNHEDNNYQEKPKKEYKSEQERFGEKGESIVKEMLLKIKDVHKSYLFNNFTYMYDDMHSTEIDHIFICKGGIFIIETKSNKGIIYGNDNDNMWYQEKEAWQDDKEFMNPVKQNQTHINLLRKMFDNNPPKMYSLVIFPYAKSLENVNSKYVHNLHSAYKFILDKINNGTYSDKFMERMNEHFNNIFIRKGISLKQHKENINKDRFN